MPRVNASTPVFVLGTGRCGSSLVHEVLARHHEAGFVTNLDDLGVAPSSARQNWLWRQLPPGVSRKGAARFAPSAGLRVLGREVGPVLVDPVRDLDSGDLSPWLRHRLEAFVVDRSRRLASPVFLHRLTGWPRARLLHACFPEARFIEIVRDGRAVANSWLQSSSWQGHRGPAGWHLGPLSPELEQAWTEHDRSFTVLAALGWRLLMASYDEARAHVPPDRWMRVRYEDLVENPYDSFALMLDHMGLEWTSSFARALDRYEFSAAKAAHRNDLSLAERSAVEAVLARPLAELGYPRDAVARAPVPRQAARHWA